jgi:hypothetical protein
MSASSFPTPTSPLYKIVCDCLRAENAKVSPTSRCLTITIHWPWSTKADTFLPGHPRYRQDFDKVASFRADDYTSKYHPSTLRQPDQNHRVGKDVAMHNLKAFYEGFVDEIGVSHRLSSKPVVLCCHMLIRLFACSVRCRPPGQCCRGRRFRRHPGLCSTLADQPEAYHPETDHVSLRILMHSSPLPARPSLARSSTKSTS